MVSSFSIIIMLLAVILSGFVIYRFVKKLPKWLSFAKEYTEYAGFENSTNHGQTWLRLKWFGLGALITLITLRTVIITALALVLIEVIVMFIITQKKSEKKAEKRKLYCLGTFIALLVYALIILLAFGESEDTKYILIDFGFVILMLIASVFGYNRNEELTNGETNIIKGSITNTINYKKRILFIPVINNYLYQYEFVLNGITYKGSDGESSIQKKKRGEELKSPVEIEYSIDNPQISRLTQIKRTGITTLIIVTIVVCAIFLSHCLIFTDFLDTVRNLFESF